LKGGLSENMMKKNLAIFSVLMVMVLMATSIACADNGYCGDGFLDPTTEECDDGNTISGDGCSDICVIEFCGDGITNNIDEECDGEPNCLEDCTIDDEGPKITDIYHSPEWPSCREDTSIFATITDKSGMPACAPYCPVILHYQYDGAPWKSKDFTIPPVLDVYEIRNPVDFPSDGEFLHYYIKAIDNLGNENSSGSEKEYEEFIFDCADPTACFDESTHTPTEGDEVFFESCSDDGADDDLELCWDFGDGSEELCCLESEEGCTNPTHIYSNDADYTVTLTVTDNAENSDTATDTKDVQDIDPIACFEESTHTPTEGDEVEFDASCSDGIIEYCWDFGDGTQEECNIEETATHVYAQDGQYTVTLTVTEADEDEDTATDTKDVQDIDPIACFEESTHTPTEGDEVEFDASCRLPAQQLVKKFMNIVGILEIKVMKNVVCK
jgi:cysteine-rich repeat protein